MGASRSSTFGTRHATTRSRFLLSQDATIRLYRSPSSNAQDLDPIYSKCNRARKRSAVSSDRGNLTTAPLAETRCPSIRMMSLALSNLARSRGGTSLTSGHTIDVLMSANNRSLGVVSCNRGLPAFHSSMLPNCCISAEGVIGACGA